MTHCDRLVDTLMPLPPEVLSPIGVGACTVTSDAATRNWLMSRRWFFVAPTLLFLWILAQIDKTNVSLFIADTKFLKELNLVGHNAELGGLMSTFFIG